MNGMSIMGSKTHSIPRLVTPELKGTRVRFQIFRKWALYL